MSTPLWPVLGSCTLKTHPIHLQPWGVCLVGQMGWCDQLSLWQWLLLHVLAKALPRPAALVTPLGLHYCPHIPILHTLRGEKLSPDHFLASIQGALSITPRLRCSHKNSQIILFWDRAVFSGWAVFMQQCSPALSDSIVLLGECQGSAWILTITHRERCLCYLWLFQSRGCRGLFRGGEPFNK